ncbi:helix-turn-helix domain-containing protein [Lysinibacillus sp. NPDC093712]|uniref:helix-turn-helix domain-containing protein n=1 Tax=Lysinibacillus sp. NPDC093712 TaxID=3390579 RepID=UPI003CFD38F8
MITIQEMEQTITVDVDDYQIHEKGEISYIKEVTDIIEEKIIEYVRRGKKIKIEIKVQPKEDVEIMKVIPIPKKIGVSDAAKILGVSPQMIRRHCANGKLSAQQTFEGSGKWTISVDEKITTAPYWNEFITALRDRQSQSLELIKSLKEATEVRISDLEGESEA